MILTTILNTAAVQESEMKSCSKMHRCVHRHTHTHIPKTVQTPIISNMQPQDHSSKCTTIDGTLCRQLNWKKKKKNPVVWWKQLSGTHHAGCFCCPKAEPHSVRTVPHIIVACLLLENIYIFILVTVLTLVQQIKWTCDFEMEGFKFVLLMCLLICQAPATDRHEVTMWKVITFPGRWSKMLQNAVFAMYPSRASGRLTTTTFSVHLFLCSSKYSSS